MPKFGGVNLSEEQHRNALLIQRIGQQMGMSPRDITIAIATAMQESSLRNLKHGDRDSAGLFQQRPSQGWGSFDQVTDPNYSTQKFFNELKKVKNRDQLSVAQAAQKVQRSAYPNAYAKWEDMAIGISGGTAGGSGGGGSAVPTPQLSMQDLAQSYGFAYSFLNSDPSLKKLFQDAVSGSWTQQKFTAELKNTPWYQKNSESVRQWTFLASNDPATAQAKRGALLSQLRDTAGELGAVISASTLNKIAGNALMFGWNDAQIRDTLTQYVKAVNGTFYGAAGNNVDELRQLAWRNGIQIGTGTLQKWAQSITSGNHSLEDYQRHVREMAAKAFPIYADQLESGVDMYDIANPYIQAKAKILEQNPADIDLFDIDVRRGLSSTGQDGKPASMSLWQFEQNMRKKPEWLKTKSAQDQTMAMGHKILSDFGLVN